MAEADRLHQPLLEGEPSGYRNEEDIHGDIEYEGDFTVRRVLPSSLLDILQM